MTQHESAENIFSFDFESEDFQILKRTACFFSPNEREAENSFSTQIPDERTISSIMTTPEQRIKSKPQRKIFTFKSKMPSSDSNTNEKPIRMKARQQTAPSIPTSKQLQSFLANFSFGKVRASSPLYLQTEPDATNSVNDVERLMEQTFGTNNNFLATEGDCKIDDSLEIPYQQKHKVFVRKQTAKTSGSLSDDRLSREDFVVKRPSKNKIQFTGSQNSRALMSSLRSKQLASMNLKSQSTLKRVNTTTDDIVRKPIERLTIVDDYGLEGQEFCRMYSQTPQSSSCKKELKFLSERVTDGAKYTRAMNASTTTLLDPLKKYTLFAKNVEDRSDLIKMPSLVRFNNLIETDARPKILKVKEVPGFSRKSSIKLKTSTTPKNNATVTFKTTEQQDIEQITVPKSISKRPNSRIRPQEAVLKKLFNM